MEGRLVLALLLIAAALVAARLLDRPRRTSTDLGGYEVPTRLDRRDFPGPGVPWLVVLFSSSSCGSCAEVARRVTSLARPGVVQTTEVGAEGAAELHRRYGIQAVPLVAVADAQGQVMAGFLGLPSQGELEEAVAQLAEGEPGELPV